MSTQHSTRTVGDADIQKALMTSVDAVAEMARRVQLNGPEPKYASEKLGHAMYHSAFGLALCGAELEEVLDDAREGYRHGQVNREERR
jgi:hypothetical protein